MLIIEYFQIFGIEPDSDIEQATDEYKDSWDQIEGVSEEKREICSISF